MDEKTKMKVQNLELLIHLKSLIFKATEIDNLLSQVCKSITDFQDYDVAWAVLLGSSENDYTNYSSNDLDYPDIEFLCWKDTLKTSKLCVLQRNLESCQSCVLYNEKETTVLAKRLEYEGVVYGVFSVSVLNNMLDADAEYLFNDLVSDISMAIYSIKLKEKNKTIRLELNESRHMYRKLLETSSLPVGIMNLEFDIVYMSGSLKELMGFNPEDKNSKSIKSKGLDFLTDSFREKSIESLKEVLEKDIVNTGDVVFNTSNGVQKQVRLKISLMRNANGEPSGYMVVFHDLSSEIKNSEALRISEEQFRLLFLKAPNGISLLSPSGIIIDCNEQDAEMVQMNRSDLIGVHVKEFMTKEFQLSFEQNFKEFRVSGSKSILVKLQRKDGTIISVSRSVSAFKDTDGSLRGIIVHSRDVTEEIATHERIQLLHSAIEQSSSVFTITDMDGNITYVNKRFTDLTGYSMAEIIGNNPRLLKSGLLPDRVYAEMWDKLKNGEEWKGELCNRKKNGELYWEFASMTAIRNRNGEHTNMLKVAEDITKRKNAEEALNESNIRYHNIFSLVPNPIVIHVNGDIVDANNAALLFSKSKNMNDLLGRNVMEFVHESSYESIKNRILKLAKEGGELPRTDEIFQNLNGEQRNVRTISKIVSFKGERANMVVFEDVTEYKIAEEKVLESEKKFKDIFNLHPDPVSIADIDSGVLHEVNDAFLRILNMRREDVIGSSSYDINLFKSHEIRKEIVDKVKADGQVLNHEISFDINDKIITALVSGALFGGQESKKILFVARDISKIKSVEKELLDSNVRYRNVFSMAPNPIIIHIDGDIVDLNRAALLFSGVKSRGEIMGRGIMEFVHESSRKEILNQMRVLRRGAKILPFDSVFLTGNGERRDVRTASNIVSFAGKQAYMVFFEDITDRKQAEKKLVESESRFRHFFDLIPDPVILTNMIDGVFIEFNKAAVTMTGLSHNDLIQRSVLDYGLFRDESQRDNLLKLMRNRGVVFNEEMVFNINNSTYTMLVSGRIIEPFEDQNVLWIARDISDRKKMEQDLVQAKERAEENEKLKSSFLSNMSHEIRTPMNAILGFSDLLREHDIDSLQRSQYVDIIQQKGNYLLKMISDIMDLSKIESKSLDIKNRAVKIKSIVNEVVVSSRALIAANPAKDIEIITACKIEDSVLVNGDKYRLRQVVSNLMDNAIKFTTSGLITIRCWIDAELLLFEIQDTGCGIAFDKKDQVFDRFVQLHNVNDLTMSGSGLGLAISKGLLDLMGGSIWFDSTLGNGSKFSFSLKLFDGSEAKAESFPQKKSKIRDWSDKTILIAEDESSNQMFINVILGKTNISIIMADDGEEAIKLFEKYKQIIDLVLVDVKMPKVNGYELTRYIKGVKPELPVIALTANAMNNDREEALANGCDEYLSKPIAKELLYKTIEKYI